MYFVSQNRGIILTRFCCSGFYPPFQFFSGSESGFIFRNVSSNTAAHDTTDLRIFAVTTFPGGKAACRSSKKYFDNFPCCTLPTTTDEKLADATHNKITNNNFENNKYETSLLSTRVRTFYLMNRLGKLGSNTWDGCEEEIHCQCDTTCST